MALYCASDPAKVFPEPAWHWCSARSFKSLRTSGKRRRSSAGRVGVALRFRDELPVGAGFGLGRVSANEPVGRAPMQTAS